MLVLGIVLASVATYLAGWGYSARYVVERWRERGDCICKSSREVKTRYFAQPRDQGYIAFYALALTFVWPLVTPCLLARYWLFRPFRVDQERAERRQREVAFWRDQYATARTDDERQLAKRVIAALKDST